MCSPNRSWSPDLWGCPSSRPTGPQRPSSASGPTPSLSSRPTPSPSPGRRFVFADLPEAPVSGTHGTLRRRTPNATETLSDSYGCRDPVHPSSRLTGGTVVLWEGRSRETGEGSRDETPEYGSRSDGGQVPESRKLPTTPFGSRENRHRPSPRATVTWVETEGHLGPHSGSLLHPWGSYPRSLRQKCNVPLPEPPVSVDDQTRDEVLRLWTLGVKLKDDQKWLFGSFGVRYRLNRGVQDVGSSRYLLPQGRVKTPYVTVLLSSSTVEGRESLRRTPGHLRRRGDTADPGPVTDVGPRRRGGRPQRTETTSRPGVASGPDTVAGCSTTRTTAFANATRSTCSVQSATTAATPPFPSVVPASPDTRGVGHRSSSRLGPRPPTHPNPLSRSATVVGTPVVEPTGAQTSGPTPPPRVALEPPPL